MAKKNDKQRALRQAKRAAKQKRRKADAAKRRQHQTSEEPSSPPMDAKETEELLQALLATQMGVDRGGQTLFDRAPAVDLNPNDSPPWACTCSYTEGAARMVIGGLALPGREPPHPFHIAKLRARFGVRRHLDLFWAHQASTQELVDVLVGMGIQVDQDTLRAQAMGRTSAWDVGVELLPDGTEPVEGVPAPEVAGCAMTALWSRWASDHPCQEAWCDAVQLGYHAVQGNDGDHAYTYWTRAWHLAETLFPAADLPTVEADSHMLQMVSNWVSDLTSMMWNHTLEHLEHADDYLNLCRWVRSVRPDHESLCIEADALALVGRREEGVALLASALQQNPMEPGLYARLSDLLLMNVAGNTPRRAEALEVLKRADVLGVDGTDWDLDARRFHLIEGAP